MPGAAFGAAAGLQLVGGVLKGISAKSAADANAGIDRANAGLADSAAGVARQNGPQQAGMRAMQGSRLAGSQATGYAASGVSANSGSALDVLSDTAMVSKQDQDVIQNNAARTAWGHEAQATNFRNKASLDEQQGTSEEFGSILGGVTGGASTALMALK
jgi:hypothetical protein